MLDDLTKIQALLSVAQQYLITDAGWNLLDFVSQMRSLTSGNLSRSGRCRSSAPRRSTARTPTSINPA